MEKEELIRKCGNMAQVCRVTPVKFTEGKAKGLNAYIADNGVFNFTVCRDKCLDILNLSYKGMNINYLSQNGAVSNELANTDCYKFANGFNGGFLFTCGLDNIGAPRDGHIQHGSINEIPAENACARAEWNGNGYTLEIEGKMRSTGLFQNGLELSRKISTAYGSNKITLEDRIKNAGFSDAGYYMLYHFNIGYPMLDKGTEAVIEAKNSERFSVPGNMQNMFEMTEPFDSRDEEVYAHELKEKDASVAVINKNLGLKICFKYCAENLPYVIEWKCMRSGDYVLGIEPSTSKFGAQLKARIIPAQGEIKNKIEITVENT